MGVDEELTAREKELFAAGARSERLERWEATNVARARGLAQAIAECRDDARLDGIRESAAEIVALLRFE